jgi:hypothetical protein
MRAPPNQTAIADASGKVPASWQEFFSSLFKAVNGSQQSGVLLHRPTQGLWVGRPYFDTTLGYPVYLKSANPSVWVDSAGNTV